MYPIDFFFRAVRQYGDRTAIEAPGGKLTYRQLAERVNALATALQSLDPVIGSRVGICSNNTVEHVIALLAILASGKVWVPLNYRSAVPELERIVSFTKPGIVLATEEFGTLLNIAAVPVRISLDRPFPGATHTLHDLERLYAGKMPVRHSMGDESLQAIKFTGGSTGSPKGVMQAYRSWRATVINLIDAYRFDECDRNLMAAPISHGAGTYILPVLAKGGCHVLLDSTSAAGVLQALRSREITTVFMPPTLFYMVMAAGSGGDLDGSGLKRLIYGGAPMPVDKIRAAQRFFGPVVEVTYGQTEAPQIVTFLSAKELMTDRYVTSVGRASLLSDFAIMGADGRLLPPGETGEIVVRGPMIMSGYLELPEKTAETIVDGWLHTGDLGCIDENGYLFLRGRSREVIITGGFNVYPIDIENVLSGHPSVHDVTVFGLPDDKWGEAVTAAVQLKAGATLSEEALIAYAKEQVGSVKAPKHIHFYDDLPRNPVGKIDKARVKALLSNTTAKPLGA